MKSRAALGVVRFDKFEVDIRTQELRRNGLPVRVPTQSFRILILLLENPRQLVTRETLKKELWSEDTFVDFDNSLNAAVNRLREALGDSADAPRLIETLPRRGYRFIGMSVEVLREGDGADGNHQIIELTPPVEDGEQIQSVLALPSKPHQKLIRWALAGAGVLVLGVCAWVVGGQLFPAPPRIVATRQLTHTRLHKSLFVADCYLATDGSRVYFQEHRGGYEWSLSQVSVAGGDESELPNTLAHPCIFGSWRSGSELLVTQCCPMRLWAVPMPAGTPRPLETPVGARWFAPIPDGSGVLYSFNNDKEMHRLRLPENAHTRLFFAPDITWPHVSPDGRLVRWTAQVPPKWEIWEAGINGENPHPLALDVKGNVASLDWTSDGKLFFFFRLGESGIPTLWAKREDRFSWIKSKPTLLYSGPLELHSPLASKNSKELFAVGVDLHGELSVYEGHSSRFVPFLGGIPASFVNFSHDRQWIAYVSYPDGTLWRSRIDGSQKLQLTFTPMGALLPRWSPDDKSIAFMAQWGNPYPSIYVVSTEGGQPQLLPTGPSPASDPTWSPDGNAIAYGGDWLPGVNTRVRILDLKSMQSREVPGSQGLFSPRWSPDGKHIVAHTSDFAGSKLMLYSFAENRWQSLGGDGVGWEAWSHDSKYVFSYSKNRIIRVDIRTGKIETAANLEGVHWTAAVNRNMGWFDLTPDDQIMILRDTGTEEIYALQLEY